MLFVVGNFYWDRLLLVRELPARGQARKVRLLGRSPGGMSPNTAARAAALGVPTTLVARIGQEDLARAQLACSHLPALALRPVLSPGLSPQCDVLITPDGERTQLYEAGLTSGYPRDALAGLREAPSVVWVNEPDAGHRGELHRRAERAAADAFTGVPVIHFAQEAAAGRRWQLIAGSVDDMPLPEMSVLADAGVQVCVMTAGADGGYVWVHPSAPARFQDGFRSLTASDTDGWRAYPAAPAGAVLDTVGAGDAFLGGLLAGVHQGLRLTDALALAAWSGARAVEQAGSWPEAPLTRPPLIAA